MCNETGRPLELYFGVERDINCTIDFISDSFFHLLEFYVHNDARKYFIWPTAFGVQKADGLQR